MRFRSSITRHFSASTCSRLATKNIKSVSRVELEYVYGISSVSIALHSKKRAILDTIHVQRSNERKTTKKKDESMIESILATAKDLNIRIQYTDKGKLNNFTQDKPHQVCFLPFLVFFSLFIQLLGYRSSSFIKRDNRD